MIWTTLSRILKIKEVKNAGWLICGKIAQMLLSLIVSIFTARYLGPNNFGLISYAQTYVTFFTSLCTLGINSIIIKAFFDFPQKEGEIIGTSIGMRIVSSVISILIIYGIVLYVDATEIITIYVCLLCSISLLFQTFDTFNYWFQYKYQSKITSICTFIGYLILSTYKLLLLIKNKSVIWFAASNAIDYLVVAILLSYSYRKKGGQKLTFSFNQCKHLLHNSYHYILSSMMVAVYSQTDRFMLKQMLNESSVGFYTIAVNVCSMWTFILQAIIDSMYPTIIGLYKKDINEFNKQNKKLYAIVFYLSTFVSVIFTIFGKLIITVLYGEAYLKSVTPLKIITWYTAFSFLGVARNVWVVCNNQQKYLKYIYLGAAVINVILNLLIIPAWGVSGAAIASLITQISTSIILPLFFKGMRENTKLMLEAFTFKGLFKKTIKNN